MSLSYLDAYVHLASPTRGRNVATFTCCSSADASCLLAGSACNAHNSSSIYLVEEAQLEYKLVVEHGSQVIALANRAERDTAHAHIAPHCVPSLASHEIVSICEHSSIACPGLQMVYSQNSGAEERKRTVPPYCCPLQCWLHLGETLADHRGRGCRMTRDVALFPCGH